MLSEAARVLRDMAAHRRREARDAATEARAYLIATAFEYESEARLLDGLLAPLPCDRQEAAGIAEHGCR